MLSMSPLQNLTKKLTKVRRLIKAIRHFYGDDTEESKEEDVGQIFFQIFTDFANQYSKIMKDQIEWNDQKKRQNEKALNRLSSLPQERDAFQLYEADKQKSSDDVVKNFKAQLLRRRTFIATVAEDDNDHEWE